MNEELENLIQLLTVTCKHDDCGAVFILPKASNKFGAVFLHGNEDGYVGFTCPECKRTSLIHQKMESFQALKGILLRQNAQASQDVGQLKYRSFPYTLEHIDGHERILNLSYGLYEKHQTVSEMDVLLSFRKSDGSPVDKLPDGYWSYGFGDPICGPVAMLCWYQENQIQELSEKENEAGLLVFPRYFPDNLLIDKADDFVYTYYLLTDQEQRQWEELALIEDNPVNAGKRAIFKNVHFLSVLDGMVRPSQDSNDRPRILRLTPVNLGGISTATLPTGEMPEGLDQKNAKERLRILDHLWDNFSERDIQHLLSRTATKFAVEYPRLSQRADFNFGLFWNLKESLVREISHYIWKEALSRQRYAIYNEGASWTLVFDGKKISGLRGNGFRYIQYLVQHRGRQIDVIELSQLDGVASGKTDRGYEYQEGLRTEGFDILGVSLEVGDKRAIREVKMEIDDLERQKEIAADMNDTGQVEIIDEQIAKLMAYLQEYIGLGEHGRQFNSESTKTQRRITKSVERAIKQLEKHDRLVYRHFITAINPINSFSLSYNPLKPIDWHTE